MSLIKLYTVDLTPMKLESIEEHKKAGNGAFFRMIETFLKFKHILHGRRIWNMNCTNRNGGIAELLPNIISIERQLGMNVEWVVLDTANVPEFQISTKIIHNNIHGEDEPGSYDMQMRILYESINKSCFEQFMKQYPFHEKDIFIIHDPQLAPFAKYLKSSFLNTLCIWRCHIGHNIQNESSIAAWDFLKPFLDVYDMTVFTSGEYVPEYLKNKYICLYPSLNPLCTKNKNLTTEEVSRILTQAGLMKPNPELSEHESALNQPFKAKIFSLEDEERESKCSIDFFGKTIICQISRWDKLKGMLPLMKEFVELKQNMGKYILSDNAEDQNQEMLKNTMLLLTGPQQSYFKDDPHGEAYLRQIKEYYSKLPLHIRKDITITELPMEDQIFNHLLVNALQRASSIIVQNSLREAFGLTASEAILKGKACFIGTYQACGLRIQVRDNIDGRLITEDPQDVCNVAKTLCEVIFAEEKEQWKRNAQQRVIDNFLVYKNINDWIKLFVKLLKKEESSVVRTTINP